MTRSSKSDPSDVTLEALYVVLRALANRLAVVRRLEAPRPIMAEDLRAPGAGPSVVKAARDLLDRALVTHGNSLEGLDAAGLEQLISKLASDALPAHDPDAPVIGNPLKALREGGAPGRPSDDALSAERKAYEQYLLDQIENYKGSLDRSELLKIGDEAARAFGSADALVTENAMVNEVDRLILQRLSVAPFEAWRDHYLRAHEARRSLKYWALASSPLTRLLKSHKDEHVLLVDVPTTEIALFAAAWAKQLVATFATARALDATMKRLVDEGVYGDVTLWIITDEWFPVLDACELVVQFAVSKGVRGLGRVETLKGLVAPRGVILHLPEKSFVDAEQLGALRKAYRGWEVFHDSKQFRARRRPGARKVSVVRVHD